MIKIVKFFDKLEDHIRGSLSHHPFVYSLIGGTGVVLFWRGIWHAADFYQKHTYLGSIIFSDFGSIILGALILLLTGLFVSVFIGDSIIMSGIRNDKKLIEKSEDEIELEIKKEENMLTKLEDTLEKIEDDHSHHH